MVCLLTILLLVILYYAVGGRFGLTASRVKRLGVVAVSLGLALVLPLLFFVKGSWYKFYVRKVGTP